MEEGEQFKLKVPISGAGPFDCKVKCGNRYIPENDRVKYQVFDDFIIFTIRPADRDDDGDYKIELSNQSGSAMLPFSLKVKGN